MGMPWQVTKLALHEDKDGTVGYEISMFHRKCHGDRVLLPKMVGGGRGRKTRKGEGKTC
jgi:hypothetical protein